MKASYDMRLREHVSADKHSTTTIKNIKYPVIMTSARKFTAPPGR